MKKEKFKHDSMRAIIFITVYIGLVCNPLIIAVFLTPDTHHGFFTELGKGFAMIAFMILTLQFFMSTRISFIERLFGLDRIYDFHKIIAIFASILLIMHPFLIMAGENKWELLLTTGTWNIVLGKIALMLLVIQIIFSVFRKALKLSFERWRYLHNLAYPLFFFVFIHSLFSGGDFDKNVVMKIIWFEALAIVTGVFIYAFYVKQHRLRRNTYQVKEVIQEAANTWTLILSSENGNTIQYFPGQFIFLTLIQNDFPIEEHPFSISSAVAQNDQITVTIKESGDYTRNISHIKGGTIATVDGPYGRFSCLLHDDAELVFIAGGVGITPIMSMLRYLRDKNDKRPITLLYSCKNDSIIFRKELEDMSVKIKVIFIISRPSKVWKGETGRLNQEKITKYIGQNMDKKGFYLCGPMPMMKTVTYVLSNLKVPKNHVYFENFVL